MNDLSPEVQERFRELIELELAITPVFFPDNPDYVKVRGMRTGFQMCLDAAGFGDWAESYITETIEGADEVSKRKALRMLRAATPGSRRLFGGI